MNYVIKKLLFNRKLSCRTKWRSPSLVKSQHSGWHEAILLPPKRPTKRYATPTLPSILCNVLLWNKMINHMSLRLSCIASAIDGSGSNSQRNQCHLYKHVALGCPHHQCYWKLVSQADTGWLVPLNEPMVEVVILMCKIAFKIFQKQIKSNDQCVIIKSF